jgi:UDP-2,3-diacylglucosamine hydrolase
VISIIAGTGSLPTAACKNLLARGCKFFVITLFPEDNMEDITSATDGTIEVISNPLCKPSKILEILKNRNTKKVLFIGKVDKSNLLKKIKFDWLGVKFLGSLVCKSDKTIMENLVLEFEKHEIEVIKQDEVFDSLMVKPGILTGTIDQKVKDDIEFGIEKASQISQLDIGQTVVVKDKMVLAVEAIEGTDKCIQRGILLGANGVVVCKSAHKSQNKKYDLPTLGPNSIVAAKPGQIKAIAWESSRTIISNKEKFIEIAKDLKISLVSV